MHAAHARRHGPGAGNLISGNTLGARLISVTTFTVQGNFIGTDATGLAALPNTGDGLSITTSITGLIGGPTAAARNIISGNGLTGLSLDGSVAANTRVFGNYIGVDATGSGAMPNRIGVFLGSIERVIVGGIAPGEGNVIAHNTFDGVITSVAGGVIRGNSIHSNGGSSGIGVDFGAIGTTPNDVNDADAGSSDVQNFPILTSAASNSAGATVSGLIASSAGAPLLLDFYANDVRGLYGFGQGRQYLGTIPVVTDGFGNATFTAQLPAVAAGRFITATATNVNIAPYGHTGEFSQSVAVAAAPEPSGSTPSATGPGFALAGFDTGLGPISVAAGDVNGDGFDDLVTANSKDGTVSVLLANGVGAFADAVAFGTGGKKPAGVVLGKFNGDNFPDIAVTNGGSGTVALLLGVGDGTFGDATTFAAGSKPGALVAADFDHDGFLDLACIIARNKVCVLPGSGTGTLAPGAKTSVGKGPVALAVGDFNGDGFDDLGTANSAANNVSVLRNDGAGGFTHSVSRTGAKPVALTVADFDGDGFDDIAVAHGTSRFVSVLLSHGAAAGAQFASQIKIPYPGLKGARAIAAGDVDGDGRVDLIVANGAAGSFSLLLGRGAGLFRGPFETHLTGEPQAGPVGIAFGDFDGDGRLDFAIAELNASDVVVAFRQS